VHIESLREMQACYDQYVKDSPLRTRRGVRVIDVGGSAGDDGYRPVFQDLGAGLLEYLTTDIQPGAGVTHVVRDPYELPFRTSSADLVVCGQVFEHCEYFWRLFAEMIRVLKEDGNLFLIAPSSGYIHRAPVDCYRFNPDAYRALARFSKCDLLNVWRSDHEPWHDLVGVFRKRENTRVNPFSWLRRIAGGSGPALPVSVAQAATSLAKANQAYFERRFAEALRMYSELRPVYAEDPVFLTNLCHAASEAGDFENCYWAGMRLVHGFYPGYATLERLGRAALKLGRYGNVLFEIVRLRESSKWALTAYGWEIAHHTHHRNDSEGRWSACRAAEAIISGFASRPYPEWTVDIIRTALARYGESRLLEQLEVQLRT